MSTYRSHAVTWHCQRRLEDRKWFRPFFTNLPSGVCALVLLECPGEETEFQICVNVKDRDFHAMSPRREDVQGIRGWAVILVVLFQFYPNYFPNGYIGVDMYFVVSGFIIASLLKKNDVTKFCDVVQFFRARLHRILPLYFVAIILISIAVSLGFPESYRAINYESARKAYFLAYNFNFQGVDRDEINLLGEDLFSHTWSICVEVQVYALISIIFFLQRKLFDNEILTFSCVLLLSLVFHLCMSEPLASFSSLSRMWQFSLGMLVFFKYSSKTEKPPDTALKHVFPTVSGTSHGSSLTSRSMKEQPGILQNACVFSPVLVALLPIRFDVTEMRLCITVTTALILYANYERAVVITNDMIRHVGDISYVLYLAHLPLHSIVEFYSEYISCPFPFGILVSFVLATISQRYVENVYRSLPQNTKSLLSFVLFVMVVVWHF
ncbi:hypothetical protein RB195_000405 [Necator americanus]|uniref:Acyltransferase 3 domain-containing protein n=1 Tax=Necator americanus TaxID=51031 RepID=A0ABR1D9J8_NECAM